MADIAGNTSTTAQITGTGTYTSVLDLNLDSDWWRMSLMAGRTYMFKVTGDGSGASLDEARLVLRDVYGNQISYVADGGSLSFSPTTVGTYYLDVADVDIYDNAGEGNYIITTWMSDLLANNNTTTGVITGSGATKGVLGENTDSDWYKVTLVAGRSYAFSVTGDGSISSLDDANLILRDANGNQISTVPDGNLLSYTAAVSGTYYLDVRDSDIYDGAGEGNFVLNSFMSDTVLANASTTAQILTGHELRGRIDAAQDRDWYRLNTKEGVTYELRLNGVGSDPLSDNRLILRDKNGNQISLDDGSASNGAVLTFKATSTGPYYIEARSDSVYDIDTGNFILGVRSDERTVTGTSGNDSLSGMDNDNYISGLAGSDLIRGNGGNDTLNGGLGNDTMSGGSGFDFVDFAGSVAVRVNLGTSSAQNTGQGYDKISLTEGVLGSSSHDRLTGSTGDNWLQGQSGNDTISASSGNDTLVGGTGHDVLEGGSGIDTLVFLSGTGARTVNLGLTTAQSTLEGTDIITGIENAIGDAGRDTLIGSSGANLLDGGAGHDSLNGGAGNDTLIAGAGNDKINGGSGIDTLDIDVATGARVELEKTVAQTTGEGGDLIVGVENIIGGDGNDRFYGDSLANRFEGDDGDDYLYGRAGADRLFGGGGNDTLRGGTGNDRMTGGDDADVFYFETGAGSDRIDDFKDGVDRIEFASGANSMSDLSFSQVGSSAYIKYAGGTIIVDNMYAFYFDSSDFIFS